MSGCGTVYIVDDDLSLRRAVARLCQSAGLDSKTFGSAAEFLGWGKPVSPACIVLDLCMPGVGGLDLQAELTKRNIQTPVVFMTGHGDIPSTVRAMKNGAVDLLTKPFNNKDLLEIIRGAIDKDVQAQQADAERAGIRQRLERLTPREREVFDLVICGLLNKQIADKLGASEQTIKVHRARVMDKMGVLSVAELVKAAVKAGVTTGRIDLVTSGLESASAGRTALELAAGRASAHAHAARHKGPA
jgi:RNA polymerase sigma factor (sigma-70 family)